MSGFWTLRAARLVVACAVAVATLVGTAGSAQAADLVASRSSLSFADTAVTARSADKTVTITNSGSTPVNLSYRQDDVAGQFDAPLETDGCFSVEPLAPGASCTAKIAFTPTSTGPKSGTFKWVYGNGQVLQVSVSGTGTPQLSIAPAGVAFAAPVSQTSAPETVTITNNGSTPVNLSYRQYDVAGQFAAPLETDGCFTAEPLAAGASCTANVSFTPTSAGVKTGTFKWVYGNGQSLQLAVTGSATSQITVSSANLRFGDVAVTGRSTAKTVTITNSGSTPVNLSYRQDDVAGQFAAPLEDDGCFSVEPLAPGASCTAQVSFTPTSTGPKTGTFSWVYGNGDTIRVAVSGTGTPQLSIAPDDLEFTPTAVSGRSADKTVTITNNGGTPVNLSYRQDDVAGQFDAPLETDGCFSVEPLAPGASCTAKIAFTPTSTGPKTGTFKWVYGNGQVLQASVSGTGVAQLSISPASVQFPDTPVSGRSADKTVTITNNGSTPVNLSYRQDDVAGQFDAPLETDGCFSVEPLAPGASCTAKIAFTPTSTGPKTGTFKWVYGNGQVLQASVSGTGIVAPMISVAPVSMDFGTLAVSSASPPQTVTVTNTGGGPLHVTATSLTGDAASDYSVNAAACTSQAVAPGAACQISVVLTPSTAGARRATLHVTSDAVSGGGDVALTGTGNAAPALRAPASVSGTYHRPLSFDIGATDPEGDHLSLTASGLPDGLSFSDDGNGGGHITGTVAAAPGTYTASFSVADGYSTVVRQTQIVISRAATSLTYGGPEFVADGRAATLSATLAEAGDGSPLAGREVTLALGRDAGAQSCAATTTARGVATCTIATVRQPLGPTPVSISFAGDALYEPTSRGASATVFAYLSRQAFVTGDASTTTGATVTFFDARWGRANRLSSGSVAPNAFKGWTTLGTAIPRVGDTWSVDVENGPLPPSSVPTYMAIVVTSRVAKTRSVVSGPTDRVAIVRVAAYDASAGTASTASVLGFLP